MAGYIAEAERIELPSAVLETAILPLNYAPMLLNCRESNPEFQNQNLTCYHYTTVQCAGLPESNLGPAGEGK